jgi:hypothetical protein
MTASELKREMDEAQLLVDLWKSTIPNFTPGTHQMLLWLRRFGFDIARQAIERTSTKMRAMNGQMDSSYLLRYCTSVAKDRQERAQ